MDYEHWVELTTIWFSGFFVWVWVLGAQLSYLRSGVRPNPEIRKYGLLILVAPIWPIILPFVIALGVWRAVRSLLRAIARGE
jgi:hypothetical protein